MSEDWAWLVPFCFLETFWAMSAAICTDDLLSKHISRSCFLNAKLFPSHTSLPHAVLSHTTFLHAPHLPQLSRTTLSHMSHSHTTLYNNQSSPISFVFPAFSVQLQPLFVTCGVIRSFNLCCFCRLHLPAHWPLAHGIAARLGGPGLVPLSELPRADAGAETKKQHIQRETGWWHEMSRES